MIQITGELLLDFRVNVVYSKLLSSKKQRSKRRVYQEDQQEDHSNWYQNNEHGGSRPMVPRFRISLFGIMSVRIVTARYQRIRLRVPHQIR